MGVVLSEKGEDEKRISPPTRHTNGGTESTNKQKDTYFCALGFSMLVS